MTAALNLAAEFTEGAAGYFAVASECSEPESAWYDPAKAQGYRAKAEGLLQDAAAALGFDLVVSRRVA